MFRLFAFVVAVIIYIRFFTLISSQFL